MTEVHAATLSGATSRASTAHPSRVTQPWLQPRITDVAPEAATRTASSSERAVGSEAASEGSGSASHAASPTAMTRVISSAGGIGNEGGNLLLGDGANNLYTRAALTFDLAALPGELTGIEAATVGARQLSTVGTPYADLGALAVDRVIFESMDASVFDSTALETMGSMSTDATLETKTADVTTAVQDDYANFAVRDGRSQFRLQFEETTDSKSDTDLTQLDYGTVGLVVVYTAE